MERPDGPTQAHISRARHLSSEPAWSENTFVLWRRLSTVLNRSSPLRRCSGLSSHSWRWPQCRSRWALSSPQLPTARSAITITMALLLVPVGWLEPRPISDFSSNHPRSRRSPSSVGLLTHRPPIMGGARDRITGTRNRSRFNRAMDALNRARVQSRPCNRCACRRALFRKSTSSPICILPSCTHGSSIRTYRVEMPRH